MDLLGETDSPRGNGFAVRQIRLVWNDQGKKLTENMFSFIEIRNKFINKHIKNEFE